MCWWLREHSVSRTRSFGPLIMSVLLDSWSEKFVSFPNTLEMYSSHLSNGGRLKISCFKMIHKGERSISLELEAANIPQYKIREKQKQHQQKILKFSIFATERQKTFPRSCLGGGRAFGLAGKPGMTTHHHSYLLGNAEIQEGSQQKSSSASLPKSQEMHLKTPYLPHHTCWGDIARTFVPWPLPGLVSS